MSSLVDSFEIYVKSRAIPVRVYTDAKEVYDILMRDFEQRKRNNEKVLLFDTSLEYSASWRSNMCGYNEDKLGQMCGGSNDNRFFIPYCRTRVLSHAVYA